MSVYDRGWIPKQKVKDILQNNRNELFGVIYLNSKQYEPYEKQIERINKIEKDRDIHHKDKIIDLMAGAFKQDDVRSVEKIKQYFERKSEE